MPREDTNRTRPSRSRGDLHILCFSISVQAGVPHLAFRGQYYTLREHSRSSSAISHRSVRIAAKPRVARRFSGECAAAPFFSRKFFFYTQRSRRRIISCPKFIALTMNFHARFPAQRAPANDDLAREIFFAMIFYASSFLFFTHRAIVRR